LSEPDNSTTAEPAGEAPVAPDATPEAAGDTSEPKNSDSGAPFWKRWLGKA